MKNTTLVFLTSAWKWILIWLFFIAIPLLVITNNVEYITKSITQIPKITVNYDAKIYCTLADEDFSRTFETTQSCLYRLGNEAGLGLNNPKNVEKRIQKRIDEGEKEE